MKRILPLILSSAAFILAFPPALKAQEIDIGPGGITVHRHHQYSREDWQRQQDWQREQDWRRQRELDWQREQRWRQSFYERHGYYPDEHDGY